MTALTAFALPAYDTSMPPVPMTAVRSGNCTIQRLISFLWRSARLRAWARIDVFGSDYPTPDGTCVRDYIHVNDLASAHVKALEYLAAGNESVAVNLGTGTGASVQEVISEVEKVTGNPVPRKIVPRRPGDPPALVADPAKAQKVLRWKAERGLDNIVTTAWNWMERSRAAMVR